MDTGDLLVYYSPRLTLGGAPLRAFTAVGRVVDDQLWQAHVGGFRPWRRRVEYDTGATSVPVADVRGDLDLCRDPLWGYQLRRGLLQLSHDDAAVLLEAMTTGR